MQKVFFIDIDDCLIETSRLDKDELEALIEALKYLDIPYPKKITKEFEVSFHRLYNMHQGKKLGNKEIEKLEKFIERVKELQKNIIKEYEQIKKWSREVFIFISAEKFGVTLNNEQLMYASRKLWQAIAGHTPFYPDSKKFLKRLLYYTTSEESWRARMRLPATIRGGSHTPKEHLRTPLKCYGIYLITSSDCRLKFNEKEKLFEYDPQYSKRLKYQRLQKVIDLGIPKKNIFIGDPFDKPNIWVFRKALNKAKKDIKKSFVSVMIGDSLKNDLLPAKEAGIEELVWMNRDISQKVQKVKRYKVVQNFNEIQI